MADESQSPPTLWHVNNTDNNRQIPPQIEIVSDEEMALIEAALAFATRSSRSSSSLNAISSSTTARFHNSRSINSITLLSKRRTFSSFDCTSSTINNTATDTTTTTSSSWSSSSAVVGDIEDYSGGGTAPTHKKKKKSFKEESLLHRFRKKKGLFVTDITSSEWCEKQKEFFLIHGKPRASKAMQAGSARHAVLEEEVIKRVKIRVGSAEEAWAIKMINFIHGANQLLSDGLTRDLPLIGFADGVCVVGVIDEIRMHTTEECVPTLVETKTRSVNRLPSDPTAQKWKASIDVLQASVGQVSY